MNPYSILGISANASVDMARQAYRRLAMKHHPDRGGDAEQFKLIQQAWDLIESGKYDPFTAPPKPSAPPPKPPPRPQAKPYAKPRPFVTPEVKYHGKQKVLTVNLTEDQAFRGCTVPFRYGRHMIDFDVRPGTQSHTSYYSFLTDPTIGAVGVERVEVLVTVIVDDTAGIVKDDKKLRVQLYAVSFIIGGNITVLDAYDEKVLVTIPEGHDPKEKIVVPGRGYGPENGRGDLILEFEPVFKPVSECTENERQQIKKLYAKIG